MKNYIAVALIISLVFVAGCRLGDSAESQTKPSSPKVEQGFTPGRAMPMISLSSLDGTKAVLPVSGRVTVVNFWATWCPPCRQELPELEQFAIRHKEDIDFYAVNIQESGAKVSEFMQKNGYRLKVLLDIDGETAKTFRINAVPTTIVADRNGIIRVRKSGGLTAVELEEIIRGL